MTERQFVALAASLSVGLAVALFLAMWLPLRAADQECQDAGGVPIHNRAGFEACIDREAVIP